MQAKANEPRVSIERVFSKVSPLRAHTLGGNRDFLELSRSRAEPSPGYNY
jgi:hypothetical protein